MKDFLLLVLFTYTGGIVEFIYETLAKGKSFYREPSSALRTARSFFLSLPCTIVALMILKWSGVKGLDTLTKILDTLTLTDALLPFIGYSVGIAVAGGFLWYGARLLLIRWHNRRVSETDKGCCISKMGTTWEDFTARPNRIETKKCVAIVYKGTRRVAAGLIESFADDFSKDKGVVLTWCEETLEELNKPPKDRLIGDIVAVYYNAEVDELIELRAASAFMRYGLGIDAEGENESTEENKEKAEG